MCLNILYRTSCGSGYYSVGGAASCSMCARGYACPRADSHPDPCSPGTYSLDAAINCTLCEAGHSCADSSSKRYLKALNTVHVYNCYY